MASTNEKAEREGSTNSQYDLKDTIRQMTESKPSPYFIAEVSSNHARDMARCKEFIAASASMGANAVKFQLFRIDELFAPEILENSEEHRRRRQWELPVEFLPDLKAACDDVDIAFSCTPFYLDAVAELEPYVDFYKIASYELLWDGLIAACAKTTKPLILSTGMATLDEIRHAVEVFANTGGTDLTLLHCVSGYPVEAKDCNLAAIQTIRDAVRPILACKVGWSDHSRNPGVVRRAIDKWGAETIEFHIDLDEDGAEYATGHCWLPGEITPVIAGDGEGLPSADGTGEKVPQGPEIPDRDWRADPVDGLRPLKHVREKWAKAI